MLPKIIFFTAVTAATVAVVLLALSSPAANPTNSSTRPLTLSLYIQPHPSAFPTQRHQSATNTNARSALVFRHTLTDGPDRRSRAIGDAQGFIIPVEHFAYSAFNIIYLTFDTPGYSGSLGVEARQVRHGGVEELKIVGGTGSFAFARGSAEFVRMDRQQSGTMAMYHVKLSLRFPD